MLQKRSLPSSPIAGEFAVEILLHRNSAKTSDIDNRFKAVLDFLQKSGVVVNDKNCIDLRISWSDPVDFHGAAGIVHVWEMVECPPKQSSGVKD